MINSQTDQIYNCSLQNHFHLDNANIVVALSVTSAHVRRHLRQKTWQQLSGMASSPPARTPRQIGHLSASSPSAPSGGPWPPVYAAEETHKYEKYLLTPISLKKIESDMFMQHAAKRRLKFLTASSSNHLRPLAVVIPTTTEGR